MYVIKNKNNWQVNVMLGPNVKEDKIIVVPPKAMREFDMTKGEVEYVRQAYGKQLVIKEKA